MEEPFQVEFRDQTLKGGVIGFGSARYVLMLHGAGQSNRAKMLPLRLELAERGIGSYAFDCIGHGETGGTLENSSLMERTQQAEAVIETLGLSRRPISIIAASMGAHTAVELAKTNAISGMVLIVPAMYDRKAYDVPFNGGFSDIIRTPFSWRRSDVPKVLSNYAGKLLVIAAEKDKVIPEEVIHLYHDSAVNAEYRCLYRVADVGHMIFTELRENDPSRMEIILEEITKVV